MNLTDLQPLLDLLANPAKPYWLIIGALIALGYVIQQVEFIPNKWIPAVLFLVSVIVTPLLTQFEATIPVRVSVTIGLLLGVIYAGVAWLIHNRVLKFLEGKWGGNGGGSSVTFVGLLAFVFLGVAGWLLVACSSLTPRTAALPSTATSTEKADALKADIIGHLSNPTVQQGMRATLTLAGKQALRRAVDDAERQRIADQMWTISDAFLTLANGGEVTPGKVESTVRIWIAGWSDPDKNDLIESANLVWQVLYPQLVAADSSGLWKTWLVILAEAARDAAASSAVADGA